MDRSVLIRAAALYLPLTVTALVWLWRAPDARARGGAVLATLWNLPTLLAVHVVADRFGWWDFTESAGTIAGMPVDLYLGWAVLWGALPALVAPRLPIALVAVGAIVLDLVTMPRMEAVVSLGPTWLVGEGMLIVACFVPAQLLARWTARDQDLSRRAFLQVLAFGGLVLGVLPQVVFDQAQGSWSPLVDRPRWVTMLALQVVLAAALLGVSAVQEFATRGGGTPVPFDPPRRLVVTGPYAYVRNPMQLSMVLVLLAWGALLESWPIAAAAVVAVIYGVGFAGADEHEDLRRRFGPRWDAYRRAVRGWIPRWRPIGRTEPAGVPSAIAGEPASGSPRLPNAHLYVAEQCGPCSEVRAWFAARAPVRLEIVAAERHPMRSLDRITYDPGDGGAEEEGVAAVARALEHLHLGWAVLGMFARLPVVRPLLQVMVDASGGGPRQVIRYCDRPDAPAGF